jgi:CrcB protein
VHNGPMPSSARAALWPVVAAVSAGGALGALARHGLDVLWPASTPGVSWTILAVNVSGSLLIGLLTELVAHRWSANRFVRPFWGVGFLGGYTTFSAYAMDVVTALERGAAQIALAYLALTLAGALTAAWAASSLAHRFLARAGGRNP